MKKTTVIATIIISLLCMLTACNSKVLNETSIQETTVKGTFDNFPADTEVSFVTTQNEVSNDDVTVNWGEHIDGATTLFTSVNTSISDINIKTNCPYSMEAINESVSYIAFDVSNINAEDVKLVLTEDEKVVFASSYSPNMEERQTSDTGNDAVVNFSHDNNNGIITATVIVPESTTPTFECNLPIESELLEDNKYKCTIRIEKDSHGSGALLITGSNLVNQEIPFKY